MQAPTPTHSPNNSLHLFTLSILIELFVKKIVREVGAPRTHTFLAMDRSEEFCILLHELLTNGTGVSESEI